ncbi:hypothetical protein GCM10010431_45460 [Streptomyces kunmingensis]
MVGKGHFDKLEDPVIRELSRLPERIVATLHDQNRHPGPHQLIEAGLRRFAGRMQRKTEGEHTHGPQLGTGPTGDAGPGAPPSGDNGQPGSAQRGPDATPPRVQGLRRRRHFLPGNAPRLFDEGDGNPMAGQDPGEGLQIAGFDTTARTVADGENHPAGVGGVPSNAGIAMFGRHDDIHAIMLHHNPKAAHDGRPEQRHRRADAYETDGRGRVGVPPQDSAGTQSRPTRQRRTTGVATEPAEEVHRPGPAQPTQRQ